jgi:hypothetical protein
MPFEQTSIGSASHASAQLLSHHHAQVFEGRKRPMESFERFAARLLSRTYFRGRKVNDGLEP